MEARPKRGRGWGKTRRADGMNETGKSDARWGRGRSNYRGRGRSNHYRGKGQLAPELEPAHDEKNPEDLEDEGAFCMRKLESNQGQFDAVENIEGKEEPLVQRGEDYHVLLGSAGDSFTQFQLAEEKTWEIDSLATNQMCALFMNLQVLTQSLQMLPVCKKLNIEPELAQVTAPLELPVMLMNSKREAVHLKAAETNQHGTCRSQAAATATVPVLLNGSCGSGPETEESNEELDFLLTLQTPATNLNQPQAIDTCNGTKCLPEDKTEAVERGPLPAEMEEDLEDWLDSMIS